MFIVGFDFVSNLIVILFNHFPIFLRLARDCWPTKQATWKAHVEIWRVCDRLYFASHFATQSKLQVTRETHYSWNVMRTRNIHKKILRAKHLRVRDCLPTILYIISLEFPFTPTSPSTHPWEVLSPNTYLTHSECWEKFWCLWEALEEAIEWWM